MSYVVLECELRQREGKTLTCHAHLVTYVPEGVRGEVFETSSLGDIGLFPALPGGLCMELW